MRKQDLGTQETSATRGSARHLFRIRSPFLSQATRPSPARALARSLLVPTPEPPRYASHSPALFRGTVKRAPRFRTRWQTLRLFQPSFHPFIQDTKLLPNWQKSAADHFEPRSFNRQPTKHLARRNLDMKCLVRSRAEMVRVESRCLLPKLLHCTHLTASPPTSTSWTDLPAHLPSFRKRDALKSAWATATSSSWPALNKLPRLAQASQELCNKAISHLPEEL